MSAGAPPRSAPAVAVLGPSSAAGAMAFGAAGGAVAAAIAIAALMAIGGARDLPPLAAPNAVGAWFVRWLQTAAPTALDGFYVDATIGGGLTALVAGALGGAVVAGGLARLPEDHPLAWGMVIGLAGWALTQWVVAPALDPLFVATFDARALLAAHMAYGIALGGWCHGGRLATSPPGVGGAAHPS